MSGRVMPFVDLAAQRRRLGPELDTALRAVMDRVDFIQGREVAELEAALCAFVGAAHCVTCANGTDALTLVALAEGLGPGDAVFVPAFTYVASAEAFRVLGITTVLVDVEPDGFGIDLAALDAAIGEARGLGYTPRMVVAVDLFGEPCDYEGLRTVAARHDLVLLADAAQSFGARYGNRWVGTLADYTTTSFFPSKPLGCYGDGGAVFTQDAEKAALLRSLAQHGKGSGRYDNVRVGLNSRLDTLQAAVLLHKLAIFPDELEARQRVASRYDKALAGLVATPRPRAGSASSWAQYTLRLDNRDAVRAALGAVGIPTAVYYPLALNRQEGYRDCPVASAGVERAEALTHRVLSLPMHPYLDPGPQDSVVAALREAVRACDAH